MKESFAKNKKGIFIMLFSALCVCIGQFLWKVSVNQGFVFILLGFAIYGIGALFMIIAYRYGSLSVLQPMQSAGYILSLIMGYFFLKEKVGMTQCLGIGIIMLGIILIGGGDQEK